MHDRFDKHWTLWECEKLGTDQRVAPNWPEYVRSVGLRPAPLSRTHGLHHGEEKTANLGGLCPEDAAMVRGMIPGGWKVRG